MDFNKYYIDQAKGIDGFQAPYYQKGHGIGSLFKRFFRWIIPIIHDNAEPIVKHAVNSISSNVSSGLSNFINDVKNNKPMGESVNQRFNETLDNLKRNIQSGKGKKKLKRIKSNSKYKTIFD
jgi:hypothetical protein